MLLNNQELIMVNGGAITTTFLNSLSRLITTVINFGRQVGSSIRRISEGKLCSI